MAHSETGKQRASRIPLDYYKKQNPLERWKVGLGAAAALLAFGWWAFGFVRPGGTALRYSRGPVAAAHATWDAQCDACHVPFAPVGGQTWAIAGKCESCHAGPVHHAAEKAEDRPNCAACHREHRGRDALLARVSNDLCTQCHDDLAQHTKPGSPASAIRFANHVTRFDLDNHPAFQIPRESPGIDSGKLRFSHARHLAAGMVLSAGGQPFTLGDVQVPEDRERYRRRAGGQPQTDGAAVQLDCASCHRLDAEGIGIPQSRRAGTALRVSRNSGATMQPIQYENQCRACHRLTYDPSAPNRAVPHGLQPDAIHEFLWSAYAADYLAGHSELLERSIPPSRMPGSQVKQEEAKAREVIEQKVEEAEKILYRGETTCAECHQFGAQAGAPKPDRILPPNIPEVWFQHALFDHSAHRAVSCRECHARAFPDAAEPSLQSSDVLLPEIASCRTCHRPAGGGSAAGLARSDCAECHRYHNGDRPLEGPGAAARNATTERTIDEFLSGARAPR